MTRSRSVRIAFAVAAIVSGFVVAIPHKAFASLPTYGSPRSLLTEALDQPTGVAVDSLGDVFVADSGNRRVEELSVADVQTTVGFSGLGTPAGVAVDSSGDVYVTDSSGNQVDELSSGQVQTTIGFNGLSDPTGIALDSAGDIFVVSSGSKQVFEWSTSGVQSTVGFTGLVAPQGVAVDAAGDVFVTDSSSNTVVEFTANGTQKTLGFSGLSSPEGVAVDGSGDVYVASSGGLQTSFAGGLQVDELSPSGSQSTLGLTGFAQYRATPCGLAIDPAGDLYVGSYGFGTGESGVSEWTTTGVQRALAFSGLYDGSDAQVAVDSHGDTYVTFPYSSSIMRVTPSGVQSFVGFTGLFDLYGVAVDSAGDVFAADTGNNRVVELNTSGVQTTLPFNGLSGPGAVAVDSEGDVFVTSLDNDKVFELSASGEQSTLPFTGLIFPEGVAVDSSGDVFVANTLGPQEGNPAVEEVTASGGLRTVPFTGFTSFTKAISVAVDSSGDVLVGDRTSGQITRLSAGGVQSVVESVGPVTGITLDSAGNLYSVGGTTLQEFPITDVAPSFSSASSASFQVGSYGSFAVSSDGYPNPSISYAGDLPAGLTFVDNGDGTATISGTPEPGTAIGGTGGSYSLTLSAMNAVSTVEQSFDLTVSPPPAPSLSGSLLATGAADGTPISVDDSGWVSEDALTYSFRWADCTDGADTTCTPILGAVAAIYTPSYLDVGRYLAVTVTASDQDGQSTSLQASAGPVGDPPAPANVSPPQLGAGLVDGKAVVKISGQWTSPDPLKFSWQWLRCTTTSAVSCTPINGASKPSFFRPTVLDIGSYLAQQVTATDQEGQSTTIVTNVVGPVMSPLPPANLTLPTITGADTVGSHLVAHPGKWASPDKLAYTYQWQACTSTSCAPISRATRSSVIVPASDLGDTITVTVTATDEENQSTTARATPTAAITG